MTNKVENLIICAGQSWDAGKTNEVMDYIDRALEEDATYFPAWELMLYMKLNESYTGNNNTLFKFPVFWNLEKAQTVS